MLEDKKYIRMEDQVNELWETARNSYIEVELNPPVQDGYIRYLVVRPDLIHTREGKHLEELISIVGMKEYCKDKLFLYVKHYGHWVSIRWANRKHRKNAQKLNLGMRDLHEHEYNKIPEHLKSYFYKVRREVPGWHIDEYYDYRCSVPMWKFKEKIEKHYIYSRRVLVGSAQSDYDRFNKEIYRRHLWPKMCKVRGRSYQSKDYWNVRVHNLYEKLLDKEAYSELE